MYIHICMYMYRYFTKDLVTVDCGAFAVGHKKRYAVSPLAEGQPAVPVELCRQLRERCLKQL